MTHRHHELDGPEAGSIAGNGQATPPPPGEAGAPAAGALEELRQAAAAAKSLVSIEAALVGERVRRSLLSLVRSALWLAVGSAGAIVALVLLMAGVADLLAELFDSRGIGRIAAAVLTLAVVMAGSVIGAAARRRRAHRKPHRDLGDGPRGGNLA